MVPYSGDITTTLADLQQQLFEQDCASDGASLAELWDDEEFLNEAGTATVLDMPRRISESTRFTPSPARADAYVVTSSARRLPGSAPVGEQSAPVEQEVREGDGARRRGHPAVTSITATVTGPGWA